MLEITFDFYVFKPPAETRDISRTEEPVELVRIVHHLETSGKHLTCGDQEKEEMRIV